MSLQTYWRLQHDTTVGIDTKTSELGMETGMETGEAGHLAS